MSKSIFIPRAARQDWGLALANTRHQWWKELAALSPTIASMKMPTDQPYVDPADNTKVINTEAKRLSGSNGAHSEAIARWIEGLAAQGVPVAELEKYVTDLTSRTTYGSFSELAAYGLLLESEIPFRMQIPMTGKQVLNPNGCDLDGVLDLGAEVYFDVKSLGLHEQVSNKLVARLQEAFPSKHVAVGGTLDVSVGTLTDLSRGKAYADLLNDLTRDGRAQRGAYEVQLEPRRDIQIGVASANPFRLAEEHASYAFHYAKQFVRRKPFILIFVIHPWLGGLRLKTNFANDATTFMRSFARRTFLQFRSDRSDVFGMSKARASRLLSGVMFIDAWQGDDAGEREHYLYVNPRAKNPIPELSLDMLRDGIPDLGYDDFKFDQY